MTEREQEKGNRTGISLYIHVPFCRRKCAYCDFYSLAGREGRIEAYRDALCTDLKRGASQYGHPRVRTIFFGGGTPTLLSGADIRQIMSTIQEAYDILPDCEITMEGNPGTLTADNLIGYAASGVNRLSIGVQSFSDRLLRNIGRIHTAAEATEAVHKARQAGFDNLNLDLMYGLPGQTPKLWQETLEEAIDLNPEHLSCYSLIVEPGTSLAERIEAGLGDPLPDEDMLAEMEMTVRKRLSDAGYERYEVSNYAKPGRQCRHNIVYWECQPYLGFGPGAHSDCGGRRFSYPADLDNWLKSIEGGVSSGFSAVQEGTGDLDERRFERMMMGLRMTRGVDIMRFQEDFGIGPETIWPKTLTEMRKKDMLISDSGRIYLTEAGMDVMNYWLVRMLEEAEKSESGR